MMFDSPFRGVASSVAGSTARLALRGVGPPSPRLRRDSLLCAARVYLAKMLRKRGVEGPVYVSAKRTQIIWQGKQELSGCEGSGSDGNGRSKNLGSFWENEPILGAFEMVLRSSWGVSDSSRDSVGVKMLRTYRLRKYEVRRSPQMTAASSPTRFAAIWGRAPREGTRPTTSWKIADLRCGAVRVGASFPFTCFASRL